MADCSKLVMLTGQVALLMQAVCGTTSINYQDDSIDLGQPFRRASMHELVQESLGERYSACLCHLAAVEKSLETNADICVPLVMGLCVTCSHLVACHMLLCKTCNQQSIFFL